MIIRLPDFTIPDLRSDTMKFVSWLSLFLIPIFVLAGCAPVGSTIQPTQVVQLPSATYLPATNTVVPTSTPTLAVTETPSPAATQTPLDTLRPEVVEQKLQPLFREPLDCAAPCFWGITPQKTTLDEANLFFNHLGFKPKGGIDWEKGNDYFSEYIIYESGSGLRSRISFFGYQKRIETIKIQMSVPHQDQASRKVWAAYTPETLINRYDSPSRVDFSLAFGPDTSILYNMVLYFDANSMIVDYIGHYLAPRIPYSPRICPFTAPPENVWVWLGDNPRDQPHPGVEVEKATSLTIDQFTQLMLGDPQKACFTLNEKAFQ